MEPLDICKAGLYIRQIIHVIQSRNPRYHETMSNHARHSDAFVYILSGSCDYRFRDGTSFTARPGDILYLAQNAAYTMYIHDSNYRFIYCDFTFDSPEERRSALFSPKNRLQAENLFVRLHNTFSPGNSTVLPASLSILYGIYDTVIGAADSSYISSSLRGKMADAKARIDTHFADKSLSIPALAQQADMSQVYFRKLFKEAYGCTPSQYAVSVRLQRAKELMNYPFLTLEECAGQSGFSSVQYFCKVFRQATGTTPAKYRKNQLFQNK